MFLNIYIYDLADCKINDCGTQYGKFYENVEPLNCLIPDTPHSYIGIILIPPFECITV